MLFMKRIRIFDIKSKKKKDLNNNSLDIEFVSQVLQSTKGNEQEFR